MCSSARLRKNPSQPATRQLGRPAERPAPSIDRQDFAAVDLSRYGGGMSFARSLDRRIQDTKKLRGHMNARDVKRYREKLVALRERVGGEVNHVVESLHD